MVDLKSGEHTVEVEEPVVTSDRFSLKLGGLPPVLETAAGCHEVFIRSGHLQVWGLSGGERIQVFDVAGRTVLSVEATSTRFSAPLPTGVYVVKVDREVYMVR